MAANNSQNSSNRKFSLRLILSFILAEVKALLGVFITLFWKATIITAILIFIALELLLWTGEPQPDAPGRTGILSIVIQILVVICFSFVYAIPVGLIAGCLRVMWRLCGGWSIFPLIAIPLSIALSFWLFKGWLHTEAIDVIQALKLSAHEQGLKFTTDAIGGGVGVHAGPVAFILLIFLLPFLIADLFFILIDFSFLLQFGWFLLCFFFVVLIGTVPASCVSAIALGVAFVKRLFERYFKFIDAKSFQQVS
jgi:hypothetical protein